MAKYIDCTALLERLPDVPYKGSVRRVLMQTPPADVAPRCPHYIRNAHDRGDDRLCEKWGCEVKDVQPVRHGRWNTQEEKSDGLVFRVGVCSVCGHTKPMKIFSREDYAFNFCPNCGARMDGGGE